MYRLVKTVKTCPTWSSRPAWFLNAGTQQRRSYVVTHKGLGALAYSSIMLQQNDSAVHIAVTRDTNTSKSDSVGLSVDYRSRPSAHGRIGDSVDRRNNDVLISRIIDRSVRPMFNEYCFNSIHINATLHACDEFSDIVPLTVNAASIALMRNKTIDGHVGCVRIGYCQDKFVVNPTAQQLSESKLDLLVSGSSSRILM